MMATFASLFLAVWLAIAASTPTLTSSNTSHKPAKTFAACQCKTARPLSGCPKGTIYVSKDSPEADFETIQAAIASLPHDNSSHIILISPGNYTEQLNVTRPGPLTLLGISDDPYHNVAYADVTSDTTHKNLVTVLWSSANQDSTGKIEDNAVTSVLTVAPTYDASLTGSGSTGFAVPANTSFGNKDFRAYNIDFRNVYAEESAGPALTASVSYANAGFYGCGFYSYQDTVYIGKLGNAYFYDSVVAGETDFLYGFGTAWFEESTLTLRGCGGGVTAWKGTNTTFTNKYGAYIDRSRVIAANSTIASSIKGKCALGRPWNSLHRSIFMNTYLDASILPAGYIIWSVTDTRYSNELTFMAIYDDDGPGFNLTAEETSNITRVLNGKEIESYDSPAKVFMDPEGKQPDYGWIDGSVLT